MDSGKDVPILFTGTRDSQKQKYASPISPTTQTIIWQEQVKSREKMHQNYQALFEKPKVMLKKNDWLISRMHDEALFWVDVLNRLQEFGMSDQ